MSEEVSMGIVDEGQAKRAADNLRALRQLMEAEACIKADDSRLQGELSLAERKTLIIGDWAPREPGKAIEAGAIAAAQGLAEALERNGLSRREWEREYLGDWSKDGNE